VKDIKDILKKHPLVLLFFAIVLIGFLTSADKEKVVYNNIPEKENEKVQGYTPFQIGIWHLKTAESFRPNLYPDGKYPSIAFGYNLVHGKVEVPQTWESGTQLLYDTYNKVKKNIEDQSRFDELDEWQKMAMICRFYNRGPASLPNFKISSPKLLKGCCNGTYTCGNLATSYKIKNGKRVKVYHIQESHNPRRMFEYYIFTKQFDKINFEELKQKCIDLQNKHE